MIPVKVLTELPARLGGRIRYEHARQDLQRALERIVDGAAPPTAEGGRPIGVATFASGPWHLVLEMLLSHALRLRGARPELLVCDVPDLPICDERTIHSHSIDRCDGCFDDKRALLEAAGVPWRTVSSVIGPDALSRARQAVSALADDQLTSHRHRDWPVGEWLHVSACHFLRRDARGSDAEEIAARRRLLVTAMVIVEATERWLDALRPAAVIAESGAHLEWRIALELSRARGIPVICREMGKGGWDHHLYALNADSMSPDLESAWSTARHQPLSAAEEDAVDEFIGALPSRTYAPVAFARPASAIAIPSGHRVAVAFTNVTWDLATAGRDAGFDGGFDWLCDTIETLSTEPRTHLIIRVHPAECSAGTREPILEQLRARWPSGLPNVTLIGPDALVSARELVSRADVVLVYNSTAGLEAAIAGRPVVIGGAPHFGDRGFTIDLKSRDEHRRFLRSWADGAAVTAPHDAVSLARRYCHLFFLRYHVRMGWTTSPLEPPYELLVSSMRQLAPGANQALDLVCESILSGSQVMLPRTSSEVLA